MTLFIVEDDKIQCLILEMMVSKLGIHLKGTEAYGEVAVERILNEKPDIVLLDVMLKDSFNGISVAREIKQHYDPVIIYITGNSDDANKKRAETIGYFDFIPKPVSLARLKITIESISSTQ